MKPLESFSEWGWFENHAAVYFGKDNAGKSYYVTKNGKANNTPTVMSYDQLDDVYNFWSSPYKYAPK
ncbi:hypothetical protein [Brumimicrobium aurantiacum]|uniref:Uncharacterized protein n=1 Tax=Brumimicrobium aurantiacum TaxID=1737063 RepID=A0A3E1EZU3_9FLAO|nr:hypothetical protein [Brumimicrobium aurantiacum]RFC55074.1 hypothetical protein DXU93_04435 [Brumimicrobium aurantiacum]